MKASLTEVVRPSLAESLEAAGVRRVHRIGTPEEQLEKPTVARKPKDAAPTLEEAQAKGRKKRKYTKRAGVLPGNALVRGASATGVTYAVNELGAITIAKLGEDGIDLDLADTKRLAVFIERTSTLRK